MDEEQLRSRYRGCLMGLAVGDVLGCPVESMSPAAIQKEYGTITGPVEQSSGGSTNLYFWRMPGVHSDDTQQALAIADVLIEVGEFDQTRLLNVSDLKPLAGLTNLKELNLNRTKVTDLTPLIGLTKLEKLTLGGTNVSDSQIDALQKALPKLKINR